MSDLFLGIMLMALHKAMISNPSLLALAYRPSGCVGQEGTPYSNKHSHIGPLIKLDKPPPFGRSPSAHNLFDVPRGRPAARGKLRRYCKGLSNEKTERICESLSQGSVKRSTSSNIQLGQHGYERQNISN